MIKKALLVISFGSSIPEARAYIKQVEDHLQNAYPERAFYNAYTSPFIRKRLSQQGEHVQSPQEVLEELYTSGYEDVVMIPTVIIPGVEYDKLIAIKEAWQSRFLFLHMGRPLLEEPKDLIRMAEILAKNFAVEEEEALLLFGHGSRHLANFIYPSMQTALRCQGYERAYVATIEGWPTLEEAMKEMKLNGIKKVFILPFLLIAGKHVLKDMLGEAETSWINQLKANGFQVRYCTEGLSALEEVLDMFVF